MQAHIIKKDPYRNLIGYLGLLLPTSVILIEKIFGNCTSILPSISAYYHTLSRDFFVGTLVLTGIVLFFYRGYGIKDNIAGKIAGIAALGIAFFPTEANFDEIPCLIDPQGRALFTLLHLGPALIFFLSMIFFCWILFPKTDQAVLSQEKINKNRMFYFCGAMIFLSLAVSAIYLSVDNPIWESWPVIFWAETVGLLFFALAWLTKGQTFWKD